jgi:hypothetical protein
MAQDPQQQEQMKQWGEVVARAWSDETYKQRLLSDPKAVLAEAGLPLHPNVQVLVHEAAPTQLHLVLPPPPPERQGDKLSEAELGQVAGGQATYPGAPATWMAGGTCKEYMGWGAC